MADVVARMDDWGRPAWIALMVLGFALFWPVGLAILAFLIWSGRMGCGWHTNGWKSERRARWERMMGDWGRDDPRRDRPGASMRPTGNRAFDEYREDTLRRLEEEANEFKAYLERLRHAKDKAEFDQYMAERRANAAQQPGGPNGQPPPRPAT